MKSYTSYTEVPSFTDWILSTILMAKLIGREVTQIHWLDSMLTWWETGWEKNQISSQGQHRTESLNLISFLSNLVYNHNFKFMNWVPLGSLKGRITTCCTQCVVFVIVFIFYNVYYYYRSIHGLITVRIYTFI